MKGDISYKKQVITDNPHLSITQLADRLKCSTSHVWAIAKANGLPYFSKYRTSGRQKNREKPSYTKEGFFDVDGYVKQLATI